MATPSFLTFDAEGHAVDFEVWVDDLQLFLQCDRADGLSLFYLTSGVSPAPPATADSTVRSQWATRDAAARLAVRCHLPTTEREHFSQYKSAQTLYDAVVARYSSPATAALSRLFLPYLFPDLTAFPTVADLIMHLCTSDTRFRAALPAEFCAKNPPPMYLTLYYVVTRLPDSLCVVSDHFLSVCPTTLTVDLLEERLLVAEQSIVTVGASRGDPRTPIFEGRSVLRLPLAGAAALAGARGAEVLVGVAGAVEVVVEAVEGVGVVVGVVAEVEVSAAAVEAAAAVAVEEGAAAAVVAEAEEGVEAAEAVVELVEALHSGLREWYAGRQRGGGAGPCTYVLRTGDRAGEQCGGLHSTQRCFGRLTDSWRHQFPDATKIPRSGDLSRAGVAIFELDYDAILAAMYALSTSDEGDCYLCVPPDPGIEAAALGAGETAALGASESAAPGAGESALSGTASAQRSGSGGGQRQQQQRSRETPSPQQLREWYAGRQRGGGAGPCTYVLRTGDRAGEQCGGLHSTQRCFGRLTDSWRHQFPDATEIPRSGDLSRAGVAIFELDYDAILAAMYALSTSDEGDCYLCVPPDPGIEAAALGAGETAALGASESAAPGAGESALSGTASAQVLHTFTLDSGASRSFFRDRTTLTPLSRPVAVSLADPSGGPVLASFSTVLPCPAAPSGSLSGLYLPSFSTNLVSGADLQDQGVDQFTPASQRVTHCTCARTGRHLATFTSRPGSSLYTLSTESPPVSASSQVAALSQYAAHQLNLQPRVSLPETSPTLLWTGKVGDASAFWVWGSRAFVRDLSADKLSPHATPCVFLGFPPDAPGWQFYHPTSRRVRSSQDVTFDEWVPYYRLFPYRTAPLPSPPLFLAQGPPLVDPLPPQGPAPSGVSQVDAVEPVEVAVDSGAATGTEPAGAGSSGAESGGAETGGAEPVGAETGGAEPGGTETGGAEPRGTEPGGAEPGGAWSARVASRGASSKREVLSPQELREWFARRWGRAAGAGGTTAATGSGGTCPGSAGAAGPGGTAGATGVGPTGGLAGASGGPGAAGSAGTGAAGAGASGGVGAGVSPAGGTAGAAGGTGAAGPAGVGAVGAGGAADTGATPGGTGAVPVGTGDPARPRPYFVPLLEQVLGLPPSPGPASLLECSQPVQSQSQLMPVSPLPAPSPYAGPTGGLAERREPASSPASPVRTARTSRRAPRPPAVPGTHQMTLRPSTAPLRVPLPSPPESSLPVLADPPSDSLRAASPTVARLLSTVVTDPSFESTAASALVAELVDFAARCRLDYAASLVAESASVCPPSIGGECALGTDVLEDRQEEFQCFAAALPHLVSTLLAPEGDPDAPDIPTARSYAEAIEGTYVDEVPPPGANIVSGMWIFRVKRPSGSPPVFKARYVARGFSQRQGVDYFHTFSPTPKMTILRVLLHVAALRDYELHSLDFSTAFLQGSLHEEIWLRRPPGFTRSFPPGTQWSLRRPVYGLRQAPREWHDTLRTTLAALGFAPSTADPSLFLRTDTSLSPFYVLVYVDDLVFATADTAGLAHVKSELQKRHTCTDLGELRSYLGLQITRDRAQRTITLTQSHMVQQVLQCFDFTYSSPQATPLSTRHSLSALPSDESVEPSGPYPELVGCLMYLMTCTRPDLAYPLSILARYVAPGRHRPEHMAAAKRVLRYLCSTSGMGLVLGGRRPVVLTGHADASWADDQATQALALFRGGLPAHPLLEHRTKHIALRYFLARELQQRGQLRLAYVASKANTADIFTKALVPGDHQRFCTMLGLVPSRLIPRSCR
ncbi:unnamed protein product [Closterium sp. NIES-53]